MEPKKKFELKKIHCNNMSDKGQGQRGEMLIERNIKEIEMRACVIQNDIRENDLLS